MPGVRHSTPFCWISGISLNVVWLAVLLSGPLAIAQDAPVGPADTDLAELAFLKANFPISREGYFTLEWNTSARMEDEPGRFYRVTELSSGLVFYEGVLPQAFISGLADGEYQFSVSVVDSYGAPLASSPESVAVTVQHWPRELAVGLLLAGLVVFLAVVWVLLRGWAQQRADSQRADSQRANSPRSGPAFLGKEEVE